MTDYSKLSDFEINQAIACNLNPGAYDFCRGEGESVWFKVSTYSENKDYCNNPADAWPLMLERNISACAYKRDNPGMVFESWWEADFFGEFITKDKNPLRAAMIVFLMMNEKSNGEQ